LFFTVPPEQAALLHKGQRLRVSMPNADGTREYEVEWVDTRARGAAEVSHWDGLAPGVFVRARDVREETASNTALSGTVEVPVGTESLLSALRAQARGERR
jgi:hypothetical protein